MDDNSFGITSDIRRRACVLLPCGALHGYGFYASYPYTPSGPS